MVWCNLKEEAPLKKKKACYFLVSVAAHSWIEQWVRKPQAKAALNASESLSFCRHPEWTPEGARSL